MQIYTVLLATLALAYAAPAGEAVQALAQDAALSGVQSQATTQSNAQRLAQQGQAMSGYQGSMTNHQQVQDTLNYQLKNNNGHANQAAVNAFITGADSQIDNAIATVSDALAPLTLGASKEVGNFLLGPFVQSVTNGAEVLLSNLIGGGADLVDDEVAGMITGDYSKLASFASKSNVDTSRLQSLNQQISKTVSSSSKGKRDGISGAITNIKQTVDTLVEQLKSGNGHAGQATVNAAITGLDSQIDNFASTLAHDLNGVTLGISGDIGDFLLGPFFQSLTNGAEVVISNVIGGSVDIVTDGTAKAFSKSLGEIEKIGKQYRVNSKDVEGIANARKQIEDLKAPSKKSHKEKRDGISGAITNIKQTVDTLVEQLKSGNGHAGQATVNAAITGLDSQIDNFASTLAHDLNGVTLGISGDIGDFLLGPFFQSLTNGAEVVISNVIGGSVDLVTDGTAKAFSKSLGEIEKIGKQYSVNAKDVEGIANARKQIEDLKAPAKKSHKDKRASDADMSGSTGSMTNNRQVQDTLNRQLQSHNGHAAQAVVNAYITGADSQIDNAIATVSDALAPLTLGASKEIGNFLLGPFVQSVTNGAEVVISNLVGGSIDSMTDVSVEAYNKALSSLSKAATKYGVDEQSIAKLSSTKQKLSNAVASKSK